jgi:hypothetical protein
MMVLLSAEDLLAGADTSYDVDVPDALLNGAGSAAPMDRGVAERRVRLRPLTIHDVQLIAKAARDDDVLTSVLMIQRALVEPKLKEKEIAAMRSGMVRFLVDRINRISGLTSDADMEREVASSPLVQAFVVLAQEFGWTPEQVRNLTVGQVLGYLDGLRQLRSGKAS